MKSQFSFAFLIAVPLIPLTFRAAETLPETVVFGKSPSLTVPSLEQLGAELHAVSGGVDLIDAEVFKRGRAVTLKDVLDYSPGVFIQPRFGAEEARISIRGSGIQRTFHGRGLKLMQDGVPVNLADGGFDFQAIEPLVSKAVEVYRGANALQYGSTTLGGAINFISPTGYDASPFTARAEFGSFNTRRGLVSSGTVLGSNDYFLSLSHFSQDGFREHSNQNNQRLFANVGHRFHENLETRFYLTLATTDSELPGNLTKRELEGRPRQAARNAVGTFDYITSDWKRNFDLIRLANKTTWQEGDQKVTLSGFWSRKDLHHPILFVIDQLTDDFGVGVRYDNTAPIAGRGNRFSAGINPTWGFSEDNRYDNVRGRSGTRRAFMRQAALNFDVFAEDQLWVARKVALTLGSQVSYAQRRNANAAMGANAGYVDEQSWWGFSPKAGILYQPDPGTQVFANLSRSFEPPSFGELVGSSLAFGAAPYLSSTPARRLKAQKATTAEIGTRGSRGPVQWDAVYYHSWIERELLEFQIAPNLGQTRNAGKTRHQGVELGLGYDFLYTAEALGSRGLGKAPKSDSLVLQTHYLWNDFRYSDDPVYGDGPLAGIPEHYIRTDLTYTAANGFYLGPNVECVPKGYRVDARGTLFTDAYLLLGARAGWRRPSGWSVYVETRNLTNKRYAATTGVVSDATGAPSQFLPGDGRAIYGGIEFRW